jgi:hypothetical protein
MTVKDDLMAELDALEQEELDAKLLDVEPVSNKPLPVLSGLPGVPTTEPRILISLRVILSLPCLCV